MKNKLKLLGLALIAGGTMFAQTHVSVGIGIGGPAYYPVPAPPPVAAYPAPVYPAPVYPAPAYVQPPCPGPGYSWVAGYWTTGPHRSWVNGYWRAPVVAPYRYAARDAYRGHDHRFENGFRGHGR